MSSVEGGKCPFHNPGALRAEVHPELMAVNKVFLLPEIGGSRFIPINRELRGSSELGAVGLHSINLHTPRGEHFTRIETVKYPYQIGILDARILDSIVRLGLVTPQAMQQIANYMSTNPDMTESKLPLDWRGGDDNIFASSQLLDLSEGMFTRNIITYLFGTFNLEDLVQNLANEGGWQLVEKGLEILEVDLAKIRYAVVRKAIVNHNYRVSNFGKDVDDSAFLAKIEKRFTEMMIKARAVLPVVPSIGTFSSDDFVQAVKGELGNATDQLSGYSQKIPSQYLVRPLSAAEVDEKEGAWVAINGERLLVKKWNKVFLHMKVGDRRLLHSYYRACTFVAYAWVLESDLTL